MSSTWGTGQKVRAIDMVPQKRWTVTDTTATGNVTTTETVALTSGSQLYRAGRAYLLTFRGILRANTGAARASLAIRDTNAAGTTRMTALNYDLPAASINFGCHFEHYVVNSTGIDIPTRTLVLTIQSSSGANSVFINAGATIPYYWSCIEMGAAADFPEAVAL